MVGYRLQRVSQNSDRSSDNRLEAELKCTTETPADRFCGFV